MKMQSIDFEQLLKDAKHGDEEAAEQLFRDVQSDLAMQIQSTMKQHPGPIQPSDIMQTVLYQAWMQLARCQGTTRESFVAWLKTIADNRRVDSIRLWKAAKRGGQAKQVEPERDGDGLLFLIDEITNGQVGPATGLANRELSDVVKSAVASLPVNYRQPTELFYWKELPASEIAARMEIPEGTVFVRLSRAREMLRDQVFRALGTSIVR